MPRTTIPVVAPLGPYPALPLVANSIDVVPAAMSGSSGSNGNQVAFGNYNRLLLVFQNTGAAPYTITITSVAASNTFNRSGDIATYSLEAGDIAAIFVERNGFIQTDGNLYLEATNAAVKLAPIGIN